MALKKAPHPDIFDYFPQNHRESNICKVDSNCNLQAYARYMGDHGVLVIPNTEKEAAEITAVIPFADMGLDENKTYEITEILNGYTVRTDGKNVSVTVDAGDMAVVHVKAVG